MIYLAVALGGAIGGALRYWVGTLVDQRHETPFPLGTLVVNVTGALLIGAFAALAQDWLTGLWWSALAIGLCGSYTTVSSFSLQCLQLVQKQRPMLAAIYVLGSVIGCLLGTVIGFAAISGLGMTA